MCCVMTKHFWHQNLIKPALENVNKTSCFALIMVYGIFLTALLCKFFFIKPDKQLIIGKLQMRSTETSLQLHVCLDAFLLLCRRAFVLRRYNEKCQTLFIFFFFRRDESQRRVKNVSFYFLQFWVILPCLGRSRPFCLEFYQFTVHNSTALSFMHTMTQ